KLLFLKHKLIFLLLALGASSTRLWAAPEPAQRADDFVDRIGVATHWNYPDTPYGSAYDDVKKLLGESGIRHVRDSLHPRQRDLFNTYGIKATTIFGPPDNPADIVARVRENLDFIEMIEGPNEVDISSANSNYKGKTFPQGAIDFQNDLFQALRSDPQTSRIPIIAPSIARLDSNLKLAPLRSFDYLVMHSYAGGQMPSRSLYGNSAPAIQSAAQILGSDVDLKRIVATKSGYHTATGANLTIAGVQPGGVQPGGVQPGVSERAQAKYIPRHFAEYFNEGIRRTFIYEFIDEFPDASTNAEASFGLVRRDLTPKPAYFALQRLISILREARWDATKKRWVKSAFVPQVLDYRLDGDLKNVHRTLLQKANGTFYLLLWQEVSSFDTSAKRDISNAPVAVTLRLNTRISDARAFSLSDATRQPRGWRDPASLTLQVSDEVLVVELKPEEVPSEISPSRTAPRDLTLTSASSDSISIDWKSSVLAREGGGYFVWRLGKYLGRTSTTGFTDKGLIPGAGYEYSIQAYDKAGRVSPFVTKVFRTRNERPDLIVTNILWTPDKPQNGDNVTFRATVKNIGNGATPEGTTLGLVFFVNGTLVSWSDTSREALAPGALRSLESNSGPGGTALWKATTGPYTIRVQTDDVNRIVESDETNNSMEKTLGVVNRDETTRIVN
ncbi:MAG TPA: CARDB domain-containing protein, partial [Abditibacteriaceae bacterium]|nr:CARDB domain-containing protein [Abditibacteriaceae bacterium]